MKRFIALTLCVLLLMPLAAFAEVREKTDGIYYSFTSYDKTADFFETDGLGNGENAVMNWFSAAGGNGAQGSMTFCFDGTKSKETDGITYDMNGVPTKVEFLKLGYGYMGDFKDEQTFLISEDKENWYPLDAVYTYGDEVYSGSVKSTGDSGEISRKYGDVIANMASWIGKSAYTLNVPACFTDDTGELHSTKYVRVAFDIKIVTLAFAAPGVEYKIPFSSVSVKDAFAIAPGTTNITVLFSEAADTDTVTADSFTVETDGAAIAVTDAVCSENGRSVRLTLAEPLTTKTAYRVNMQNTVLKRNGKPFDRCTAEFTTLGGREEVTFRDDMTGESYFTESNADRYYAPDWLPDANLYRAGDGTASWIWKFDGTSSKEQEGINYVFDGILKFFSIDYYHHNSFQFEQFSLSASPDGKEWTELEVTNKGGSLSEAEPPKPSWVGYGTAETNDIPLGTRYLKIEVHNISSNNFLFAYPTVRYESGSGKTFVDRAELDHYNNRTILYVTAFADIDESGLTTDKFSVDGENPAEVASGNNGRRLILTFDGVLDFDRSYYIRIDGLSNLNGESVAGAEFKTEKMSSAVTVAEESSMDGDMYTTRADIRFNYKKGVREIKIAYLTLCFKDDKITARSVDTKTVKAGETSVFSNSVRMDTGSGEYAVTFILRDSNGYYPLDKTVIYPTK